MSIDKKLFAIQGKIGAISKDSKNPFFKSKYFDINSLIEHIQPLLQEQELLLLQPIQDGVQYSILVDVESGEERRSGIELPKLNDAQKLGSSITYFRRYTLQSLLGLRSEDDDANLASNKVNNKPQEERKPALTQDGFDYLMSKGSATDIATALSGRRMTTEQRNQLTSKLQ